MAKTKDKKQNKPKKDKSKKVIVEVKEKVLEKKIEKIISPYLIKLNNDVERIKSDIDVTIQRKFELQSYLESDHQIYSHIQEKAFAIQKEVIENNERKVIGKVHDEESIFFDFENNTYKASQVNVMPECYLEEDKSLHISKENGIYVDKEIYSASRMFLAKNEQIKDNSYYINSFEKIINASIDKFGKQNNTAYFCMLPEAIDDFNTKIRRKLMTKKGRIISIPKSISVTYSVLDELNVGERYTVINMDGMHPIVTQLSIGKDKENKKVILREGFIKNHSIKFKYLLFAEAYVKLFEEKYLVSFSEIEKNTLIHNKHLYKVFLDKEEVIFFKSKGRISVIFDDEIYQKCIQQFITENLTFDNVSKIFIVSSIPGLVLGSKIYEVNPSVSFEGLKLIHQKMINEKDPIIWKERLPKVSLEVIDDNTGRFKEINLIEENSEAQSIQLTLDSEIELSFRGTVTLQKNKEEYYLPLKRDIYLDDINSEKEAYFKHNAFPLDQDLLVELVVKYNYLSDSPIKLYAKPKKVIEAFKELENEWVDSHEIKVYSGPVYEGHPKEVVLRDDDAFKMAIKGIESFVKGQTILIKEYFKHKISDYIHRDFEKLSKIYFFLKSTFDSDNVQKPEFEELYIDFVLDDFYESVYQATRVKPNLYKDVSANLVRYYQQGLLVLVADMIVAAWYFDPYDENVLSIYEQIVDMNKTRTYIKLSRCIASNEDDIYGVFDKLTIKLSDYFEEKYKADFRDKRIEYIRTLSQNCWFNKNWMKLFYESSNGHESVTLITQYILEYLKNEEFRRDKEYRDIMEFLVCLTIVKNYNQTLFHPNKSSTKELLITIKKSYDVARIKIADDCLKSRLQVQQDQGLLFGYHNYIYILIMILSGEGQINLVGYHDDE